MTLFAGGRPPKQKQQLNDAESIVEQCEQFLGNMQLVNGTGQRLKVYLLPLSENNYPLSAKFPPLSLWITLGQMDHQAVRSRGYVPEYFVHNHGRPGIWWDEKKMGISYFSLSCHENGWNWTQIYQQPLKWPKRSCYDDLLTKSKDGKLVYGTPTEASKKFEISARTVICILRQGQKCLASGDMAANVDSRR